MNHEIKAAFTAAVLAVSISGPSRALDFESPEAGDSSFLEESDTSDVLADGADVKYIKYKMSRRNALGVSVGESKPGVLAGLETLRMISPTLACESSFGQGIRRSTEQRDGEFSFQNTVRTTSISGGMAWWPSANFPFTVEATGGAGFVKGQVKGAQGSTGQYTFVLGDAGSSLALQSFFESGLWIKWVLLSGHYVRILEGNYSGMSGTQMSIVRDSISGFKIVGVANLTVGYSW